MRYAQALNTGLSGLLQSFYSGKTGAANGAEDAYKRMQAESEIRKNQASALVDQGKLARMQAQQDFYANPERAQAFARDLNSGDLVTQARALVQNLYGLPDNATAENLMAGQTKLWDRGDAVRAQEDPVFRLNLNGAKAAAGGKLFDPIGETGYAMDAGKGNAVVVSEPLAQMYARKTGSEVNRNNRSPASERGFLTLPQKVSAEGGMRDDYRQDSKNYLEIKRQAGIIQSSLNDPSAAGTLAAATSFMKMLDPGSVVRESELGMAMQSTGALDRFMNYSNVISSGKVLTAQQKADFSRLAGQYAAAAEDAQRNLNARYKDIAERNGLDSRNIVMYEPPQSQASAQTAQKANFPKAVQWMQGRNIQTQAQFNAAVQELQRQGWSAAEIKQIQQQAGY